MDKKFEVIQEHNFNVVSVKICEALSLMPCPQRATNSLTHRSSIMFIKICMTSEGAILNLL